MTELASVPVRLVIANRPPVMWRMVHESVFRRIAAAISRSASTCETAVSRAASDSCCARSALSLAAADLFIDHQVKVANEKVAAAHTADIQAGQVFMAEILDFPALVVWITPNAHQ